MSGLKAFRAIPQTLVEWSRWIGQQSVHAADDSNFTGIITGANLLSGAGQPEGRVTAAVGTIYTRTDGTTGATLYVKETGVGSGGWVAK